MIVRFNNEFIDEINSRYKYKGYTQILLGKRYYLGSIMIKNTSFVICVPLHSKCRKHYLSIKSPDESSKWSSHGLDFQKMLLLKTEDLKKNAIFDGVHNVVWNDIINKKKQLLEGVKLYLFYIINLINKRDQGRKLTRIEKNDLNYTSLNCFSKNVDELKSMDLNDLVFYYNSLQEFEDFSI